MSRELLQWLILIVLVLMLAVLLALLIIAIRDSRDEQPIHGKSKKRRKKKKDPEELPAWSYVVGAILLLAAATAVMAGLYFLTRAVIELVGNSVGFLVSWVNAAYVSASQWEVWRPEFWGWGEWDPFFCVLFLAVTAGAVVVLPPLFRWFEKQPSSGSGGWDTPYDADEGEEEKVIFNPVGWLEDKPLFQSSKDQD